MSPILNLSKVRVPRKRRGIVPRGRLIDALHQGIERKLTYISAPAGYGKTSLLVDFRFDVDTAACWYHVSADDVTLHDFVRYLILSLRQQYPEFGIEIDRALQGSPDQTDPTLLAIEFINEVIHRVDEFTLLFIDDFHIVGEIEPIVVFVWHLLEHLPGQIRLVIASRNEYGIPTARLYVRGEIALLGKDDLAFRADEIQSIVNLIHHEKLADAEAEELARRSDGWIVAILLALRAETAGSLFHFEGGTDQIYKYLAEEVLRNEPAHLRRFMLESSIVDEFSIDLANHLAGTDSAAELIAEIDRRNLFLVQTETAHGTSFRYHQLFQDFLRSYLEDHDPELKKALHERAGEWLSENEDWEKAVEHKLAAGDRLHAARWMDREAKNLYVAGRTNILSGWLEVLTRIPDLRAEAPELLLNQAKVLINEGEFNHAESLLSVAEPIFERSGLVDQQKNTMITRGMGYILKGRFREALDLTDRWHKTWERPGSAPIDRFRHHQMARIEGLARARTGDSNHGLDLLESAVKGLQEMLDTPQEAVDTRTLSHDLELTFSTLGFVGYQMGLIQKAQTSFQRALELQRTTGLNRRQMATALNNLGYLYYLTGQYALAVPLLREALEIIRPLGRNGSDIFIYNSWGELLMEIGELSEAEAALRESLRIGESRSEPRSIWQTNALLARLEALRGDFNQAFHHLREGAGGREESDETAEYQLVAGQVRLAMGRADLAAESLAASLDQLKNSHRPTQNQALAAFLLGAAHFRQGNKEAALDCLEKALNWSAVLGYDQFLVVAGRNTLDFLAFAAGALRENVQLKSIVERVRKFKTGLAAYLQPEAEEPPARSERLEVFGFGPGRVVLNGVAISNQEWRAAKSREIFFYLMDGGGSRGAAIKLEFWPDKDPIRATSVFQSTLWRARQAMGDHEIIVLDDDLYHIAPNVEVWYDVAEFDALILSAAAQRDAPRKRAHLLQQALELYSGDFLEKVYSDWAEERRARLKMDYLAAMFDLAGLESVAGHHHKARRYYERIVEIDPFHDDAHLAIAGLLLRQGRPSAARKYCLKIVSFLESEGLSPSAAFSDFYRELSA